jgi:hypothetical protein
MGAHLLRIALKCLVDRLRCGKVPAHSDGQAADGGKTPKHAAPWAQRGICRVSGQFRTGFDPSVRTTFWPQRGGLAASHVRQRSYCLQNSLSFCASTETPSGVQFFVGCRGRKTAVKPGHSDTRLPGGR